MLDGRAEANKRRALLVERLRKQNEVTGKTNSIAPEAVAAVSINKPNGGAQPIVTKADAASSKFRIEPKLLDDIFVLGESGRLEIPHIVRLLVSTLLQTNETAPVCILLPSTEYVAQFVAILTALECFASDFPAARDAFICQFMKPGIKVRALPEGNVFVVGDRCAMNGIDGVFLHYTGKQTSSTHGRHLIPLGQLFRYEPTTRKLPVSRSSTKLSKPKLTRVDDLAGTGAFGNSMLYRTRVVLVGARAQFERALALVVLGGRKEEESM
jgi:hypothetical protein